MNTHFSIKPIDIEIDESLFTLKNKNIIKGKIIALDIYIGEAITFTILLENGTIYNYIPVDKVFWKINKTHFNMDELVYNNSISNEVTLDTIQYLEDKTINCYFKNANKWVKGMYIFSIDWYLDNDLLNFVKLDNGQFAFLPNHKILIGSVKHKFKPYKKARWDCKITN